MKKLIALVVVAMLGLAGCSNNKAPLQAPKVSPEKGGSQAVEPDLRDAGTVISFDSAAFAGIWKTACMNGKIQTKYKPYVNELKIGAYGDFLIKITSFNDEECSDQFEKPKFTIPFDFSIGSEIRSGVKAFDISYDYTVDNHQYTGYSYNIISIENNQLKFHPIYEEAGDAFDGTTSEKRFQSFINKSLGAEEIYVRQ